MEKHPGISFIGGLVLFVGATSVWILDALRRLDFLQKSYPTIYAGITSLPSMLAVALAGVVAMLWGGWQFHQKRMEGAVSHGKIPVSPSDTTQAISNSNIAGDARMIGNVGRDYVESQTHMHHDPVAEARLEEFRQIDDFVVKKDEMQLRET